MIRVVLDSNVIVSGFDGEHVAASTPGELIRRWRHDEFKLFISHHILSEVKRALSSPFYHDRFTLLQISALLRLLRQYGGLVPITISVSGIATHPEDDLVLAAAVSANAEYLVTGDAKLKKLERFQGVTILTPREFLTLLVEQQTLE